VKTVVNVLWFVLSGLWMAIGYFVADVIWPFGRTVVRAPNAGGGSAIGNVIWAIFFGWWLALGHLLTGILLCITIIGIPAGVVSFKLVPLAFAPFGKRIVDTQSLDATTVPVVSA
jgi:uncharacterized membrane protein YccF (DUF307 family)